MKAAVCLVPRGCKMNLLVRQKSLNKLQSGCKFKSLHVGREDQWSPLQAVCYWTHRWLHLDSIKGPGIHCCAQANH